MIPFKKHYLCFVKKYVNAVKNKGINANQIPEVENKRLTKQDRATPI